MLNVLDEFTHECLAIRVARKLKAIDVIDVLSDLFILQGIPAYIRSDNGPEFLAKAVQEWIAVVGAKTAYIERGSPWENGYIESFNARLRDELLDGEIFYTLREAQIIIESWRRHYNVASYCPSLYVIDANLYVIDANRSGSRFGCPAGADRRLRARSTRRLAASRAERLKSQGPSSSGCNASIWRCPAARRRVFGLMPSEAAACVKFIQPSASAVSDR
jgi:hypothetical protein